jgi:uncharacterized protein YjbI with pentapeptide repeats
LQKVKTKQFLLLFSVFVGGLLVTKAVSYVYAHGGDLSLIHACVRTSNGSIRIVGANDACNSNETTLDWNIQGIQGPPGDPGERSGRLICSGCNFNTNFQGRWVEQDFSNSMLLDTSFSSDSAPKSVDMTGIKFDDSIFENIGFSIGNDGAINLTNSSFASVKFVSSHFFGGSSESTSINLSNSNFTSAQFTPVSDFFNVDAPNANFTQVSFDNGEGSSGFTQCNLTNSIFSNATFIKWRFETVDLTGATGLDTATLTDVTWSDTICPDGTNSDSNGNTCVGHLTP